MKNNPQPLRITDHALIRFLERVYLVDIEAMRKEILNICEGPASLGASAIRAEGVKFVIENGAVVTCAPDNQNLSKTARARAQERIVRGNRHA